MLKWLNENKFSIYEAIKLLRKIYNIIELFSGTSYSLEKPTDFNNLAGQIFLESSIKKKINTNLYLGYGDKIIGYEFVMLFKNISKNILKMMDEQRIDPQKHFDALDDQKQKIVAGLTLCEKLKTIHNVDTKVALLNNVRYDLVIQFEFHRWEDVHDRIEDLLLEWNTASKHGAINDAGENNYGEKNSKKLLEIIYNYLIVKQNREKVVKIVELNANEKMSLHFEELSELVKDTEKVKANLGRAKEKVKPMEQAKGKKEMKRKQLNRKLELITAQLKEEKEEEKSERIRKMLKTRENVKKETGKKELRDENGEEEAQNSTVSIEKRTKTFRKIFSISKQKNQIQKEEESGKKVSHNEIGERSNGLGKTVDPNNTLAECQIEKSKKEIAQNVQELEQIMQEIEENKEEIALMEQMVKDKKEKAQKMANDFCEMLENVKEFSKEYLKNAA